MDTLAGLIYWVIVLLWLGVLAAVAHAYLNNPKTFGTAKLLLLVLAIDTVRNIFENIYFGSYFGAKYGLLPESLIDTLGKPYFLILPKFANVIAACFVIGVLFLRWLPLAQRERKQAVEAVLSTAEALESEMEEHRHLLETTADLIVITDRDRVVKRISHSCNEILGYRPDEVVGQYGGLFMTETDIERHKPLLEAAVNTGNAQKFRALFRQKNGDLVNLDLTVVWSKQAKRFFLIGRDMTASLAAEKRLRQLALFDTLTGLPNRANLIASLDDLLKVDAKVSIATFDLDGFKNINDAYGQAAADLVLKEVGRCAVEIMGEDRVYRLGGDEFVLVFPNCADPLTICSKVSNVISRCEDGFEIEGRRSPSIGVSAGICAASTEGAMDVNELLYCSELALNEAKSSGGRKYRLFIPSMRSDARAKQDLEIQIRRAAKNFEFELHYQPQIRLSDGMVVGAEALLRWRHPDLGLLAPSTFIDVLSQSPCALDVGTWILNTACKTAVQWSSLGLSQRRIGVNLFPCQYQDSRLIEHVRNALSQSGLAPETLELEITENTALGRDDAALDGLRKIREMGVGLAFDDFGTGYASLSYLTRFPLSRIKIDRSFISNIGVDSSSDETAIVRSMITMAHNLGLRVIAEGIETTAQAVFLQTQSCDEAQGYLYAKPMTAAQFNDFIELRASSSLRTA